MKITEVKLIILENPEQKQTYFIFAQNLCTQHLRLAERERLYQLLWKGNRWMYVSGVRRLGRQLRQLPVGYPRQSRGHAGLRPHRQGSRSLSGVLDDQRQPLEVYLEAIEEGRKRGIDAFKFHSYKGGKADIPIFREVRDVVGPDYLLLNDPVCSYTLREAIEVGHVMEELDFVWVEEPMHEQKENQYREICRELDMRSWETRPSWAISACQRKD